MGPSGCMGSGLGGGRDLGRDAYFARVFASYRPLSGSLVRRLPPCVAHGVQ